mmetsp:Transcript_44472/g.59005  ORF Transcript_44472/g.59005 Transcript_44472/m.59005 type:complete len:86 (+) Transcript_44472:811-1068(+)
MKGDISEVMSERSRPMHTAFEDRSSMNCDAIDEDLSSVSHGLANKLLPATTQMRATMMKSRNLDEDEEDEDFFDALDHFQALSYQ